MKRLVTITIVLSVIALCGQAFAATVVSGWDPTADTYGGMRLREFRLNNNGGEVYLGSDLGGGARVENDWVYNDKWGFGAGEINLFEMSYDSATGIISSKVTTASGAAEQYTLSYAINPALPLNYIQMTLVARTTGTSVSITDLEMVTAGGTEDLGDYVNVTGWKDWSIYGNFDQDFTLSGKLTLNGYASSQESNKAQFVLGNVENPIPEPATMAIFGFGALLSSLRRRK